MAYDIDDIAVALAEALVSLAADNVGVQSVSAVPSNPTPSGVYIGDGEITYDLAMARGLDEFEMTVTLLVGYGSDLAAQRRLRKLSHPRTGVKALIENVENDGVADKTLGGLVDNVRVTKATAPRLYGQGDKRPLGREFTVQIRATP